MSKVLDRTINNIKKLRLYILAGLILVLPFAAGNNLMFSTQCANFFFISTVTVITLLSMNQPLTQNYQTIRQWKHAYLTYQLGDHDKCLLEFSKTYGDLKYNVKYLVNYRKVCSTARAHNKAFDILKRAKRILPNAILYTALGDSDKALGQNSKAELAYMKVSQILPDRFYPNYLLAKLYDETGQQKKALDMANELLNKDIKIESKAVEEISVEMKAIVNKTKLSSSYIYN